MPDAELAARLVAVQRAHLTRLLTLLVRIGLLIAGVLTALLALITLSIWQRVGPLPNGALIVANAATDVGVPLWVAAIGWPPLRDLLRGTRGDGA